MSLSTHVPTAHEVETFSGRFVDTANPSGSDITIEDIAHALANTCRFGGHCRRFYSVAEHAVFVANRLSYTTGPAAALAGLHHDDAEAFLGDIPRPMKSLLGDAYVELTARMDAAICAGPLFQLNVKPAQFHSPEVKAADNYALLVEAHYLLPSKGANWSAVSEWELEGSGLERAKAPIWTGGLPPEEAEQLFLAYHHALTY